MSNLQAAVRAFATRGRRAARRLRQREPAALPQHRVRKVRHVLLRRRSTPRRGDDQLRQRRALSARLAHADGRVDRLAPTGLVLGVAADWTYTNGSARIGPGDRLVCFTDGITEAIYPAGEEFGEDRLIDTIRAHRTESADRLARTIADAVAAWTGGAPQDDATLIVVAVK